MAFGSWGSSNSNANNSSSNSFGSSWGSSNNASSSNGNSTSNSAFGSFGSSSNNTTSNTTSNSGGWGGWGNSNNSGNGTNQQSQQNNSSSSTQNTNSMWGNNSGGFSLNSNNSNNQQLVNPNNDHIVPDTPNDCISNIQFHPNQGHFIVSSWDSTVRVYEIFGNNHSKKLAETKHDKPVLDCCYDQNGSNVFSACCDNKLKIWNPQQNKLAILGQHKAPIRCVAHSMTNNYVVSGSWDRTASFWDVRKAGNNGNIQPLHTLNFDGKVHAMAQKGNYLVVGLSNLDIQTFDIRNGAKPIFSTKNDDRNNPKNTSLKKQIRCIDIFADNNGYVAASVGGRVIIKHFDRATKGGNDFSYKCHRVNGLGPNKVTHVFSVNVVKFHQQSNLFASGGDDGEIVVWDKDNRSKIHSYKALENKNMQKLDRNNNVTLNRMPIVAMDYHTNGQFMIYATSYNWNKGAAFYDQNKMTPRIYLHQVKPDEVKKGK